jgi:UDP-glucose 4-epimerase
MKIVVTGGAGYIGSFMTKRLLDDGHEVTVIDSLERGHKNVIDKRAEFKQGNLLDKHFIDLVFSDKQYNGVIHFSGYISMSESMQNPGMYFTDNTFATVNLLEVLNKHHVNKIVFSSSAGVYGNPIEVPINEDHQKNPENPYGESKLMIEKILPWYQKIYGISFTALRYFNASGAALDGSMGEAHEPETHIIPNAINAALSGSEFNLFGDDYSTSDGTCIRDYIHVLDLVEAHLLAINKMNSVPGSYYFNVGTGKGFSNKEVLTMVEKVSGSNISVIVKPKRPGDANILVANPLKIFQVLGFVPKYSELEIIVKTAWKWHKNQSLQA